MTRSNTIRVSRRTTLTWFGTAMALSATSVPLTFGDGAFAKSGVGLPTKVGYGNDPDLFNPHAPWPRIMTSSQLREVATLADIILPKVGSYPAPSEVGIADFVDEWVSAPYPDQEGDRALILGGLAWLDAEAQRLWHSDFNALDAPQKTQLLEHTARPPTTADPQAIQLYGFFRRLRSVTVGAYYSLERNFPEIGYIGNVAMESFPPPTAEEEAFIDRAIEKLNL
jgi:hypothetical protein